MTSPALQSKRNIKLPLVGPLGFGRAFGANATTWCDGARWSTVRSCRAFCAPSTQDGSKVHFPAIANGCLNPAVEILEMDGGMAMFR